MAMFAPTKSFSLVEAGTHMGRILAIIDLGQQLVLDFADKSKSNWQYKLMLTYEFSHIFMEDEEGNEDKERPRVISEEFKWFPLSSDKATSTKRYCAIDPGMKFKGDWSKLIGSPVSITVVHNQKGAKTYANIGLISPIMKGVTVPPLVNEAYVFSIDTATEDDWENLPEFIQKKIMESRDFEKSKLCQKLTNTASGNGDPDMYEKDDNSSEYDNIDEVPF